MSHKDRFYFDNLTEAAECSVKAANYLVECLESYKHEDLNAMLEKMHVFEHMGDDKKHEMSSALAKAFVTPIDREDLALLSQNIDDVTDSIEEVLQSFYMNSVKHVAPDAVEFAKKIVTCCELMKKLLTEFSNFKKPEKLHDMIVTLSSCEEECDRLYLEAAMRVRTLPADVLTVIAWREIYDMLENCADACEHVGDCVDMVVMKNT